MEYRVTSLSHLVVWSKLHGSLTKIGRNTSILQAIRWAEFHCLTVQERCINVCGGIINDRAGLGRIIEPDNVMELD